MADKDAFAGLTFEEKSKDAFAGLTFETTPEVKKKEATTESPEVSTSVSSEVVEPLSESGEKVDVLELPKTYQYNRNNTSELEVGKVYKTTPRENKRWNGSYFEKNPDASPLKPLMDYSLKTKQIAGIAPEKIVIEDTLPTISGDKKIKIAEAYRQTEGLKEEAADKYEQSTLLSSLPMVQKLAELNSLYAEVDESQKPEVQKKIDELSSKSAFEDFKGVRFENTDSPVYQNMIPKISGAKLEEVKTKLPDITVGDAFNTIKQNEEFIQDAQGEVGLLDEITKSEQIKMLPTDAKDRLGKLYGKSEFDEQLNVELENNKSDANLATSFLRGMGNTMEGLMEVGKYDNMDADQVEAEMKREYYKENLFGGKHGEGLAARTAESVGGFIPDVAISATPLGFTGMVGSMAARHPQEAMKQYYFDKFSKGEKPDFNEARKYAGVSTALNTALFAGAGMLGKSGASIVSKSYRDGAVQLLKGITKSAVKDAAIFGVGGKAIQDLNSDFFNVEHEGSYTESALDMAVFGGLMHAITHAPSALKISPNKINKAIDHVAYLPKAIGENMIMDGIEKGLISEQEGKYISDRYQRVQKIVNEFPVELSAEQIDKIEPLYAENENLTEQLKEATPTMKEVLSSRIAENDRKALLIGGVPLTEMERAEYKNLITGEAQTKEIDKARLGYLRKRMEAASKPKEIVEPKIEENDSKNETGVGGEIGKREEPIETKPDESGSAQEVGAGGMVQGAQEEIIVDPIKGYSFEYESESDIPKQLRGVKPTNKTEVEYGKRFGEKKKKIRLTFRGQQLIDAGLAKEADSGSGVLEKTQEVTEADIDNMTPEQVAEFEKEYKAPTEEELAKIPDVAEGVNDVYYQGIPKTTNKMQALLDKDGNVLIEGSVDDVENFKKDKGISDNAVKFVDLDTDNPNSLINKFLRNKKLPSEKNVYPIDKGNKVQEVNLFDQIETAKRSKKTQKGKVEAMEKAMEEHGERGKRAIEIETNFKTYVERLKSMTDENGEPLLKVKC